MGTLHYIDEENANDDFVVGEIDDIEFYGRRRNRPRYSPVMPSAQPAAASNDNVEAPHADCG